MAISGSTNFTLTANQIIEKAFHRLGKAEEGEAMSARMYTDGLSSLNLIIKSKLGTSDRLWLRTEETLPLISGQESYTLTNPFVLRVIAIRLRDSNNNDVPTSELSRQEYFDLPNKANAPSIPVSWYFDPQQSNGVLYIWPAPSSDAATEYSLHTTYLRRIADMITSSDNLDMPQEWLDPVIWMLADDLETEYPVNDSRLANKIGAKAAEGKQTLDYWDTETSSLFMQPDNGY
jgi:hypothetical protein